MKLKRFLLVALLASQLIGFAQPVITNVTFPNSIGKYDKYEIDFILNDYLNPYDPTDIDVWAEFWGPNGQYIKQNAFYYEGVNKTDPGTPTDAEELVLSGVNNWKIRFSCPTEGDWQFKITAKEASQLTSSSFTFDFKCAPSNNKGHIVLANNRYLKFSDGTPYYPVGNSYPFFDNFTVEDPKAYRGDKEYGTNQVKSVIGQMADNGADFVRFEINYLGGLNLIGYDFTDGSNHCKYYNQKDAWQLDEIMDFGAEKDINFVLAVFSHAYLGDDGGFWYDAPGPEGSKLYDQYNKNGEFKKGYSSGAWSLYNPYNLNLDERNQPELPDSRLNLQNPYEWYGDNNPLTESPAEIEQKKLLRYILARWGYASNILGFELMDEADQLAHMNKNDANPNWEDKPGNFLSLLDTWHLEMKNYIDNINPNAHLITTAFADKNEALTSSVFSFLDFSQNHFYTDYNHDDFPSGDVQSHYYGHTAQFLGNSDNIVGFPSKPHMIGEHFYLPLNKVDIDNYDPHLYNLKDNLWATFFNGSFAPASMWTQREVKEQNATHVYNGISSYVKLLPQFDDQYVPKKIDEKEADDFRLYYLENSNTDDIYGWIQDVNFTYRNLLTDLKVNNASYLLSLEHGDRPNLSSSNYHYTFNVSRKGNYNVRWFDTETGALHREEKIFTSSGKLTITMPYALRQSIHADAAFIVEFDCFAQWNTHALDNNAPANVRHNSPTVASNNDQIYYVDVYNNIRQMNWTGTSWKNGALNLITPANVRADSDLAINDIGNIFYVDAKDEVYVMYVNEIDEWVPAKLNKNNTNDMKVRAGSPLVTIKENNVFFVGEDNKVHIYYFNDIENEWIEADLNTHADVVVAPGSDLATNALGNVFYVGDDWRVHVFYYNDDINQWIPSPLNENEPQNVRKVDEFGTGNWVCKSPLACGSTGSVFFVSDEDRVHIYYWNDAISKWLQAPLEKEDGATQNVRMNSDLVSVESGKVFFTAKDNTIHQYYFDKKWIEAASNVGDVKNVSSGLSGKGNSIFYASTGNQIWRSYWGCPPVSDYSQGQNYNAGQYVEHNGVLYTCDVPGWCNGAEWAYEPGEGQAWEAAWTKVDYLVTHGNLDDESCSDPQYEEATNYGDNETVQNQGEVYSCKVPGWCSGAAWAYEPGVGAHWALAWDQVGPCGENTDGNSNEGCSEPSYIEGGTYSAGSLAKNQSKVYSCKVPGWCSNAAWAYEPGVGAHWTLAWDFVKDCGQGARMLYNQETVNTQELDNTETSLVLYPNPANQQINILYTSPLLENVTFSLIDMTGKIIFNQQIQKNNMEQSQLIQTRDIAEGSYVIQVRSNSELIQGLVIIKH